MTLDLPRRYVYVHFEDGTKENAAMTDTLSREEAEDFKQDWEKWKHKKVTRVTLATKGGEICKTYKF